MKIMFCGQWRSVSNISHHQPIKEVSAERSFHRSFLYEAAHKSQIWISSSLHFAFIAEMKNCASTILVFNLPNRKSPLTEQKKLIYLQNLTVLFEWPLKQDNKQLVTRPIWSLWSEGGNYEKWPLMKMIEKNRPNLALMKLSKAMLGKGFTCYLSFLKVFSWKTNRA